MTLKDKIAYLLDRKRYNVVCRLCYVDFKCKDKKCREDYFYHMYTKHFCGNVCRNDYNYKKNIIEERLKARIDHEQLHFEKLQGKFKHFCYEWDDMAIDETCPEFASCSCDWREQQPEVNEIKKKIEETNV